MFLAPGFYDTTNRLNTTNANFVDVIHTSIIGLEVSIGHQDFWPDGGASQSGCLAPLDLVCNHMRVTRLYTESILSQEKFRTSLPCSFSLYWNLGFCNCKSTCNHMGLFADRLLKSDGDYYLSTNSLSPYSKS